VGTEGPTSIPTEGPTGLPTETPTEGPTGLPTETPTEGPTGLPTETPTEGPTGVPTEGPTSGPTSGPTNGPTTSPSGCTITVQYSQRVSWYQNGVSISIYDVTLLNLGSDTIPQVEFNLSVTPISFWSLTAPANDTLYTLPAWFSNGFASNTALTFGFIAPTPPTPPFITFILPSGCAGDSPAPPTPAPTVCGNVTFTNVFLDGWTDGATPVRMWQTTITNTGTAPITKLDISAGEDGENITQLWNLDPNGNHYSLPSYAIPLSSSAPYTFGYIVNSLSAAIDFQVLSLEC